MNPINPSTFTIDPNWVVVVLLGLVSFLMVRMLMKFDEALKQHTEDIKKLQTGQAVHAEKFEHMERVMPSKIAEVVYAKIKAMTPPEFN